MQILNVAQGTPEWHEVRAKHFTASEAPAMLGVSKYTSRQELLRQKAAGITPEVVPAQQALFDKGHAAEAAARPIVEQIIGEDLYSVTATLEVDGLPLLASFDGITMLEDVTWENKLLNAGLAVQVESGELDPHYWVQLEQQLLVSGAERAYFTTSDGTKENTVGMWYESVPERRQQIIDGWKQFAEDLANYQHVEQAAPIAAEPVKELPAVSVKVSGSIDVVDNFKVFEEALRDFIDNRLIREPQTDQDFADLDAQIKALKKAEGALDSAEEQLLSQVSTIDGIKRTKDMLHKLARDNRLMAEKLLKAEKEKRRAEILQRGKNALAGHIDKLNESLGSKIRLPEIFADFAGAMKGLKTITSLSDAVDTELARVKIEANQIADKVRANLEIMRTEAKGHELLFADAQQLVMKDEDDLKNLIAARIAEYNKALEGERKRIHEEEQRKLEEQERIRAEAHERAAKMEAQQQEQDKPKIETAEQVIASQDRPSDNEIIEALSLHFGVHSSKVIEWLITMDLQSASRKIAVSS